VSPHPSLTAPAPHQSACSRYNLGLIMRLLTGAGTPRGFQARVSVWLGAVVASDGGYVLLLVVIAEDQIAVLTVSLQPDPLA
jgi:hypothetical protein